MDEFEVMATAMCRQAGIDIGIEDLVLVRLMYDAAFGQLDAIEPVDPASASGWTDRPPLGARGAETHPQDLTLENRPRRCGPVISMPPKCSALPSLASASATNS